MYQVSWLDGIEKVESFSTLREARQFTNELFFDGISSWRLLKKSGNSCLLVDSGELINTEDDLDASVGLDLMSYCRC